MNLFKILEPDHPQDICPEKMDEVGCLHYDGPLCPCPVVLNDFEVPL